MIKNKAIRPGSAYSNFFMYMFAKVELNRMKELNFVSYLYPKTILLERKHLLGKKYCDIYIL